MATADTARLIASLELDAKKFTAGLAQANASLSKTETTLGRVTASAKRGAANLATNLTGIGIVAGGFIASQVALGVRSLEDLERVTNATKGVIESTGGAAGVTADEVRNLAQQLENLTTADDKAIQEGENMLLTFTSIGRDVFPRATKAVTNLAIAMADGNVENANFSDTAIQVGKALNDPIRGITALRRVGVQFTKDQEAQIKTLVEAGKVSEAQGLILAELEKEFGKAGEAAGRGFGADLRRFKDAVEDAQQALARGFLPVISRVSQVLSERLSDPATIRALEDFGKGAADAFEDILSFAERVPWDAIANAMKLAGQGAKAALDFFAGLPDWVQTAVLTGWGLNKLTGGALGDIVGELGKGLIKGVLGINAGVVNVNAPIANAGGLAGAVGAAGRPAAGGVAAVGGASLATAVRVIGAVTIAAASIAALKELLDIRGEQSRQNVAQGQGLVEQTRQFADKASLDELKASLRGVEANTRNLQRSLTPEGIAYQLNIDGVRDRLDEVKGILGQQISQQERLLGQDFFGTTSKAFDAALAPMRTALRELRDKAPKPDAKTTGLLSSIDRQTADGAINAAAQARAQAEAKRSITSATTDSGRLVSRTVDNTRTAIVSALNGIARSVPVVNVNITAAGVQKAQVTQTRTGPANGSRNSLSRAVPV